MNRRQTLPRARNLATSCSSNYNPQVQEGGAMKVRRAAIAAAVAVVMGSSVLAQESKKTISADLAAVMVQAAVAKCRADGIKITAKVVDPANVEKALLRDEGASLVTLEIAQMKINAVLLTGRASGTGPSVAPPAKPAPGQRPTMPAIVSLDPSAGTVTVGFDFGGAVPIKAGSDTIGVIGVSGAPSAEQDV